MVLMCRMAFILPIVAGKGAWPSTRATDTLPVIAQSPECYWTFFCLVMIFSENRIPLFVIMASCRQIKCACTWNRMIKSKNRKPVFRTMRKNAREMRA
jgi:hypothetical protein